MTRRVENDWFAVDAVVAALRRPRSHLSTSAGRCPSRGGLRSREANPWTRDPAGDSTWWREIEKPRASSPFTYGQRSQIHQSADQSRNVCGAFTFRAVPFGGRVDRRFGDAHRRVGLLALGTPNRSRGARSRGLDRGRREGRFGAAPPRHSKPWLRQSAPRKAQAATNALATSRVRDAAGGHLHGRGGADPGRIHHRLRGARGDSLHAHVAGVPILHAGGTPPACPLPRSGPLDP
jgi:hypothetical protein